MRSSGQIPRRLRRLKDRGSARIPRLSEAKVERKREGLPRGILFDFFKITINVLHDNCLYDIYVEISSD